MYELDHSTNPGGLKAATFSRSAQSITERVRSRVPSTRASTRAEDGEAYIAAVVQGRGNGTEVGIATHNLDTGRVRWFSRDGDWTTIDSENEGNVASRYGFHTKLVTGHTKLVNELESHFEMECELVKREWWNIESGTTFLLEHAINDDHKPSLLMAAADQYYALSAIGCLFRYLEEVQGVSYPARSLKISYESLEGTMFIDTDTVKNLELVRNSLTYKASGTLFGLLNGCATPMGGRLLKSCILQPSNVSATIEGRLDAVQELLESSEKMKSIRTHLQPLTAASKRLKNEAPTAVTDRTITALLQIQKYLHDALSLRNDLEDSQCLLLKQIRIELDDPDIKRIETTINECLESGSALGLKDGAVSARNSAIARLYAVRSQFSPLLDVARQTYKENLADLESRKYCLDGRLEIVKGVFRFAVNPKNLQGSLPSEFINVDKRRYKIFCSTHEMLKRNEKLQQSQQEVLLLSASLVADLLERVLEHMSTYSWFRFKLTREDGLFLCADAVAKLDLVSNFAQISSVRPEFTTSLAIRAGRHPILHKMLGAECVPNDIHATPGHSNFQLIQGPNMSGKSTYIRQIGLLAIQAMLGCFVPAEYASFPLHDSLLTRLSNDDLMEKNLSTFAVEMATTAMVLSLATKRSLVLIDEGSGLAHAIAEALIKRKATVLFATHFHDLGKTLEALPGMKRLHLLVEEGEGNEDAFLSSFQYKVSNGPASIGHYGLELAKLAALPATVITRASEVAHRLVEMEERDRVANGSNALVARRRIVVELVETLRQLAADSKMPNFVMAETLRTMQRDYISALQRTLKSTES
ncbi:hypothetical protein IAU59_006689 [Kwoniella sp. CBS 9459]